jgi:hypothetical protein
MFMPGGCHQACTSSPPIVFFQDLATAVDGKIFFVVPFLSADFVMNKFCLASAKVKMAFLIWLSC